MHNSFYRQTAFTHRKFSAEKSYAQKVLRTTIFTYGRFYTQMSSHRHKLHTETCAHSMRLHTAYTQHTHSHFLHREALLPLLNHLPFVSPLSSIYIYIYLFIYSFIYLFIYYILIYILLLFINAFMLFQLHGICIGMTLDTFSCSKRVNLDQVLGGVLDETWPASVTSDHVSLSNDAAG